MELKEPRSKGRFNFESQPTFPIFIESEIGICIDNWVPIICTGVHEGRSVIVSSPAEISALYSMGNFGKGSNSRSKPYIVRSHPKLPPFMRERQYAERRKWMESPSLHKNIKRKKHESTSDNDKSSETIKELHSIFSQMLKHNIISKAPKPDKAILPLEKSEVIDVLSSDEEVKLQSDAPQSSNISNDTSGKSNNNMKESPRLNSESETPQDTINMDDTEINAMDLEFPPRSVVVLPDSDSEQDDYFKDLKPKLCLDESEFYENLVLSLEEAYFLAYGLGCLQILDSSKKPLSLEDTWKLFCDSQENFPIYYIVYHYFRSKGWIVKPGIKFGGEFLLYKKGQPFYHASYIIAIRTINANEDIQNIDDYDWIKVQTLVRLSATAAKEILFAHVIIPKDISLSDMKESPEILSKVTVCETLLRRWVSGQNRRDDDD